MHAKLRLAGWGALGGDTIVRRSAIALDATREILFMSVSNATSAHAIAVGMHHAGGHEVAQLDINYSYPRIVTFPPGESGEREATGVFPGFPFEKDDYIRHASQRDFFYVIHQAPERGP